MIELNLNRIKLCPRCKIVKSLDEFNPDKRTTTGVTSWCRDCDNTTKRDKLRQNYNGVRDRKVSTRLKKKYGMSLKDYNNLLEKQNNVCAICKHKSKKRLAVDHCHKTGRNRGLLCYKCNTGIGHFQDSIELLEAATQYLKIHHHRGGGLV